MIRRSIHLAAAACCLGALAVHTQPYYNAPADSGPYFRTGIGPAFFPDGTLQQFGGPAGNTVSYDTGVTLDAAIGYAFNQNVAADFETGFTGAQINSVPGFFSDDSRLYYVPFLGNVILSLPIPRSNVVPYLGAGAGFAAAVFDTDGFGRGPDFVSGSESDVVPAGQIFAGVRFLINPRTTLGVGYKYFATGDPTFSYPPDNFNVGFKGARVSSILFTFNLMF